MYFPPYRHKLTREHKCPLLMLWTAPPPARECHALWAFAAYAQQAAKLYRIGILSPELPPPGFLDAFRQGLRELGYVEGRDIALEVRNAEGYSRNGSARLLTAWRSSRLM